VAHDRRGITLRCQIKRKYAWPYCSYSETLAPYRNATDQTPGPRGFDFSKFKTVAFDITATGPMPVPVRIYLRNFNPAYSKIGDTSTLTINTLTYVPERATTCSWCPWPTSRWRRGGSSSSTSRRKTARPTSATSR
jgi:hypothetical protein